jgi:AraC-like DNA-binding protein
LHSDPTAGLTALAAAAGWSPWYLSRAFHAATGLTLTAYRRRLRVRAALDDLARDPPPALAGLALRHGFADQSHLTRAVRAETGHPPAALRRLLTRPSRAGP